MYMSLLYTVIQRVIQATIAFTVLLGKYDKNLCATMI